MEQAAPNAPGVALCEVLRCGRPGTHPLRLVNGPEAAHREATICAEHHAEIQAGLPWAWNEEEGVVFVGGDLDSGDVLVPTGWTLRETVGRRELVVVCETPDGKPHDSVTFLVTKEGLQKLDRLLGYAQELGDA